MCIAINKQLGVITADRCPISSHKLNWSRSHFCEDWASILSKEKLAPSVQFDVIVASDCLFFREFHGDLLDVILTSLAPTGVAYLIQPERDGTMTAFLSMCVDLFTVEVSDSYFPEVMSYNM